MKRKKNRLSKSKLHPDIVNMSDIDKNPGHFTTVINKGNEEMTVFGASTANTEPVILKPGESITVPK